ncbi:hypothetical protein SISNIDRAFT_491999 [Sistotremastrum niveocremeum HHB9708]|uniref:F-box domain-containing protein n=1 Tax=Sistotremastrum niveocremeum HHB9708 TaxID=1314777 RepID=A0A164M5M1_9AGAM|nr:hypothetical protein SISNIDRAFT_491999 [Sistotremastrum niveocremeum HHB9708]
MRSLQIEWHLTHKLGLLRDLRELCPNLHEINLRGLRSEPFSVVDLYGIIASLDNLEIIEISETGLFLFTILPMRTRLKFLHLTCYPGDEFLRSGSPPILIDTRVWPHLTGLSLEIDHHEFVSLFDIPSESFSSRHPSPVQDFWLKMHDLNGTFSRPGSPYQIFRVLAEQFTSLHSLAIFLPPAVDHDIPATFEFKVIRPILNLPNITRFMLRDKSHLIMTDADVRSLVAAWPRLEVFWLPNCALDENPRHLTALTLSSLLIFIDHCPSLRELRLLVDARITAAELKPVPGRSFPKAFERLILGHSPLPEKLHLVIAFLTFVLPAPRTLSYSGFRLRGHGRSKNHRRWNRVRNVLNRVWRVRRSTGISVQCM